MVIDQDTPASNALFGPRLHTVDGAVMLAMDIVLSTPVIEFALVLICKMPEAILRARIANISMLLTKTRKGLEKEQSVPESVSGFLLK